MFVMLVYSAECFTLASNVYTFW